MDFFWVSEKESAFAAILMYVTLCVFQREFRYGILDNRRELFLPLSDVLVFIWKRTTQFPVEHLHTWLKKRWGGAGYKTECILSTLPWEMGKLRQHEGLSNSLEVSQIVDRGASIQVKSNCAANWTLAGGFAPCLILLWSVVIKQVCRGSVTGIRCWVTLVGAL